MGSHQARDAECLSLFAICFILKVLKHGVKQDMISLFCHSSKVCKSFHTSFIIVIKVSFFASYSAELKLPGLVKVTTSVNNGNYTEMVLIMSETSAASPECYGCFEHIHPAH